MPKLGLTAISVERLRPPKAGQVEYYDLRHPGFGLRVSDHGSKSWFLMTRVGGRLVRLTLGKYPAVSLLEARDLARAASRTVAEGKDPRVLKRDAEAERAEAVANTYEACAQDFLQKHAERRLRESTIREYRRVLLGKDTAKWVGLPLAEISKRDVIAVIEAIDERGSPGAAKRTLVYLTKFFNWCAERDLVAIPPTNRIPPPHPEVRRDRVLPPAELRIVLAAIKEERTVFGPAFLALVLTGQRRAEVAGMRWSELHNLDRDDAVWEIPGRRTKNGQTHLVPVCGHLRSLLQTQPRITDLVFTTNGKTPISGFGKAKSRLDKRIGDLRLASQLPPLPPWTIHDLRRTMVTTMNEQLHIFRTSSRQSSTTLAAWRRLALRACTTGPLTLTNVA